MQEKAKIFEEGMSYKEWLKISLEREKREKKKNLENDIKEEYKKKALEEQKFYEREAKNYIERKKLKERLSKLNSRRPLQSSEERTYSYSPLLLAYSPNKYNKYTDQSVSRNSKFLPYEDD